MGEHSYAADVLDKLLSATRAMAVSHDFYPVVVQRGWSNERYVCVVYRYLGRELDYGLCLDVLDPDRLADEADAEDTATMIRVGDLEEPPPLQGLVVGSDGTHWWGDVDSKVPREVWDRPPPSGARRTLNEPPSR